MCKSDLNFVVKTFDSKVSVVLSLNSYMNTTLIECVCLQFVNLFVLIPNL